MIQNLGYTIIVIIIFSSIVAPPSYDSLFGKIRETRKSSKSSYDFIRNIIIILLGTSNEELYTFYIYISFNKFALLLILNIVGCTIIVGVTTLIPLGMFIIGLIYMNDCPVSQHIPVYLLVGGNPYHHTQI